MEAQKRLSTVYHIVSWHNMLSADFRASHISIRSWKSVILWPRQSRM